MNRFTRTLVNFRAFFTLEAGGLDRRGYLTFRIVGFVLTLWATWTAAYWTARTLGGPVVGYWSQLLVAKSALLLSFLLFALRDFRLIRRDASKPTLYFKGWTFKLIFGIASVLTLFLISWSFVYLLFDQRGWFSASDSSYWVELSAFLLCFFVAYGILLPVGWLIGERLKEFSGVLSDAVNRIAQGDFSVNVPPITPNAGTHLDSLIEGINRMTGSLKSLEDMRREFVANVSHEIQSPLTNIAGFAEALEDNRLSEETRLRYLSYIQDETRRLSRLSEHLLRLSSLDAQARPLDLETFRLDTSVSEALLSLEPLWTAKHLTVEVDLAPVTVRADRDLLAEVWLNLVHNAIKFTPEFGRLDVRIAAEKTEVRFTDSGIGLAAADQPRVFERFFKADPSRSRSVGGNGLGLAIVKKIVELHGGEVGVESAGEGHGCTFFVSLPGSKSS